MPQFTYTALTEKGKKVRGTLGAVNDIDLFQQLRTSGMQLIDAREVKPRKFDISLELSIGRPIQARDLIQLYLHMEMMERAGVPLIEALADVRDSTDHPGLRDILTEVYRDLSEGSSLSVAMARHRAVFSEVPVALVAAGEESGKLGEAFGQLVKHTKWTDEFSSKIKKAVRYPMIMIGFMMLMFMFMMGYVVPEVVTFLQGANVEPWILTEAMIVTSEFVVNYWWSIPLIPALIYGGITIGRKQSEVFALRIDQLILRLPVIGETVRKVSLSRFSHFFAMMFMSGIQILEGLAAAQRVVINRELSRAIDQVREEVQQGASLSQAMKESGQFPALVLRMIRMGENSGSLSSTLENVTEFYDREVNDTIDRLVAMIEPSLTLVAGGLMVWIMGGVFGPMYDMFEQLDF